MKRVLPLLLALTLILSGCQNAAPNDTPAGEPAELPEGTVAIALSDDGITVDGAPAPTDETAAVYTANDIVFYLAGQGFTYGEGTAADEHEQAEADAHTVVHITKPGTYALSGKLSQGQVAVDLGEDAEEDPDAVVTLILNGVEITCTVAPGIIFYEVYECGTADEETATETVDTAAAGANVIIADGTTNTVNGSYVARIYKSYTLSEDGTEVVDNKKLHKYDAAFYSKQSMNVTGGETGTGVLNINAENEGLDSELHLTVNGGNINIVSGNDGINTNEDYVSVTTINGGNLTIRVSGETGEGDGIDSNGWLVINGGTVKAYACDKSGDAGIDSDMGISLNGGTVIATGNMLDHIAAGEHYAVFQFASMQSAGSTYTLKNADGETVIEAKPENGFQYLLLAGEALQPGTYTLWQDSVQLSGAASGAMGGFGGMGGGMMGGQRPDFDPEDLPEGFDPEALLSSRFDPENLPEDFDPSAMKPGDRGEGKWGERGDLPEDFDPSTLPEGSVPEKPQGEMPQFPQGGMGGGRPGSNMMGGGTLSTEFVITAGGSYFTNVCVVTSPN